LIKSEVVETMQLLTIIAFPFSPFDDPYSGPRKLDHLLSYRCDQERGEQCQVSARHTPQR